MGGRYRLVRQIGAGAMGAVWVAHNEVLDVDVAVKVLRVDNQKADATRLYKRLLREAQAAARLGHPSIVRVYDFGQTEDKSPYIAMELLAGESLADLLAHKPKMDVIPAIQLLLPVIDAMATAHGRGIIHRDLKPENIFLARDEYGRVTPKIVDFGVARFVEAGRSLTRSGALLGTPDYMAPEQARGEPGIDQRVDIWSVCIVLYELIVGRRPFARDATNYLAVLRAIVHEAPPPIMQFGVEDAALWRIIERGLKKRKEDRWETMRSLGQALALWLYERDAREDSMGASLKTTWLQAGLDGVKIETPSMFPPQPDELPIESSTEPAAESASSPPPPPSSRRGRAAQIPVPPHAPSTIQDPTGPGAVVETPTTPPLEERRWKHRLLSAAFAAALIGGAVATFFVVRRETMSYRASLSPRSEVQVESYSRPVVPALEPTEAQTDDVSPPTTIAEPLPPPVATTLTDTAGTSPAATTTRPRISRLPRHGARTNISGNKARPATSSAQADRVTHSASLPSSKTYDFGF